MIICCGIFNFIVLVIVSSCLILKPVGTIGQHKVRAYELIKTAYDNKELIFERIAENEAIEKISKQLDISISEDEMRTECDKLVSDLGIDEKEAYKMCRTTILHQRAIDKLALESEITAEEARQYYDEHKSLYGEEPDFQNIKLDLKMRMGVEKYEEMLEKIKDEQK